MTEQTFMNDIIAYPADDGVRLAYADWLMERGDSLGEFISAQCRIAAINSELQSDEDCEHDDCGGCKERRLLLTRQSQLWAALPYWRFAPREFLPWLDIMIDPNERTAGHAMGWVRRGFVAEVHCTIADWMRHGPALVRACPIEVYRPVGVEPRQPSNGWYEDDIGTELFDACVSLGVKEGYFVSDPWERISRAALKWACQRKAEEA